MNDKAPIAIIATFIVLFISGGAWWMSRRPAPANATPRAVTATEVPIDKPRRRRSTCRRATAWTRSSALLAALSTRPELVRWIATDDLVGQLAAAIEQAAAAIHPRATSRSSSRRRRSPRRAAAPSA